MANSLTLMLFTHDPELAKQAEDGGIDRIVVDFEFRGKSARQSGYHLEVNKATVADLRKIRKAINIPILVRANPISSESKQEIGTIISEGADIVMLPMFRRKAEVEDFMEFTGKGVLKNLLFETKESVEIVQELSGLPFEEYYIGLNDMAIDYNLSFAYDVLQYDIVRRICNTLSNRPFGFGGITVIDGGSPLRTEDILKKMANYGCSLAILRRAFKRDIQGRSMRAEVSKIKEAYQSLS
jgi:citrate lyase beta subunit